MENEKDIQKKEMEMKVMKNRMDEWVKGNEEEGIESEGGKELAGNGGIREDARRKRNSERKRKTKISY